MKLFLKTFLILLLSFGCTALYAQVLPEVRKEFHRAVLDPGESGAFHDYLNEKEISSPTLKAYMAVSKAMKAQVAWNPFVKLSLVMKYDDLMNMAVEEDFENVEIRFLRLAIEYNLPRFLGMSNHLDEDRIIIVNNMSSIRAMNLDPEFSHYILYFLDDTGLCTKDEIEAMTKELELTDAP